MYQKLFIPLFLLLFTFPLLAIDINETTEIIEEASKATQNLQKDFSALMEEETIPSVVDINTTSSENNVTAQEVFIVKELNSSVEETPVTKEINSTEEVNTTEESKPSKELTLLEETNSSNTTPLFLSPFSFF